MDTLTDEEITLLNSLTEKQKSQALALYAAREGGENELSRRYTENGMV